MQSAIRSRRLQRCTACGLPAERVCLCANLSRFPTRTRLVIVAHHTEWRRSSNTGRLLLKTVDDARVVLRGARDVSSDEPPQTSRRLVLFPAEHAREVSASDATPGLVLVVPEGSWGQTRRTVRRERWCSGAELVRLPAGAPSRYRLRRAPHAGELSTFEAVARALGILEGESVERALVDVFDDFVERSIAVRGRRGQTAAVERALSSTR